MTKIEEYLIKESLYKDAIFILHVTNQPWEVVIGDDDIS